jgi:hypothetical protein
MLRKLTSASLNSRASEISPVFGFSAVEVAVSNPAWGMEICLRFSLFCRPLCR